MKKLINFFKRKIELSNMFCGVGSSVINENTIVITHYPFKPSKAYPEKIFEADKIHSICVNTISPYLVYKTDVVFITYENKTALEHFAKQHFIKIVSHTWNWDYILDPFLDTEFDEKDKKRTLKLLLENGIDEQEVKQLRNEVEKQMYKYNFDTRLWEWCSLGLLDVLSAMRAKYNDMDFEKFYNKAIELELRRNE